MTSIPVTALKNTSEVTQLCQEQADAVLVTKNGYPVFYLVKPEEYEALREAAQRQQLYELVNHSEQQYLEGRASSVSEGIAALRTRYGL